VPFGGGFVVCRAVLAGEPPRTVAQTQVGGPTLAPRREKADPPRRGDRRRAQVGNANLPRHVCLPKSRLNQLFVSSRLGRRDDWVVDFAGRVGGGRSVGAVPGCTRGSPRAPSSSRAGGGIPQARPSRLRAAAGDGAPGVTPCAAESGWQPRTLGPPAGAKAPPTPQRGAGTGLEHRSNASTNTRAPFFGGWPPPRRSRRTHTSWRRPALPPQRAAGR
jgi:hypothetical protein